MQWKTGEGEKVLPRGWMIGSRKVVALTRPNKTPALQATTQLAKTHVIASPITSLCKFEWNTFCGQKFFLGIAKVALPRMYMLWTHFYWQLLVSRGLGIIDCCFSLIISFLQLLVVYTTVSWQMIIARGISLLDCFCERWELEGTRILTCNMSFCSAET